MTTVLFAGDPVAVSGDLPAVGSTAPSFTLCGPDLKDFTSADLTGRTILNIFPSIGTGVCQASVRRFNELAASLDDTTVLCVSADLPFAQSSFCGAEGIENVKMGSTFRENSTFGADYGVTLQEGGFTGLLARSIVVVDADGTVLHTELVPDTGQEPDYDAALAALS